MAGLAWLMGSLKAMHQATAFASLGWAFTWFVFHNIHTRSFVFDVSEGGLCLYHGLRDLGSNDGPSAVVSESW
jgi:hypothetical protein